ncbi:ankyrin repeat domain-containing protein [bacterium]|nr:MAG: ankyrin repeat domain-containing protein [bacterium]
MKRASILAIALAAIFMWLGAAFAEGDYVMGNQLLTNVTKGQIKEAEELLGAHTFNESTLGRALLLTLSLADSDSASERDVFRLSQLLVDKGADVNHSDVHGRTPLMEAALKKFETVAWLLLKSGANSFAIDRMGLSALEFAKRTSAADSTIVWLLESAQQKQAKFTVTNLRLVVRGESVIVYYDLEGPIPAQVALNVEGAGGKGIDARHVSGDIGKRVEPGSNRKIVWALAQDVPKGFNGKEMTLDVLAFSE